MGYRKNKKPWLIAAACVCILLAAGLWLRYLRQPEQYATDGCMRLYPCLIKQETGQIGELRVQDPAETGSVGFFVTDRFATARGGRTSVTVPGEGYVLADAYDPENMQTYDITDGAEYEIRGCTVEVSAAEDGLTVTVTKTAPFEG